MYRPIRIDVRRCFLGYQATVTFADDGITEDGEEQMFRGFETEQTGWSAFTHERCWRKAYRAVGGRLWDIAPPSDRQPRDPTLVSR